MASKYNTSDFRNGLKVEIDGQPYNMVYFQFVKPGKGTAFTRTKLKNMITGSVIERTYRTGEKLDAADVDDQNMQYLYEDGEFHHFMNNDTFEQVAVPSDSIQDEAKFLTENLTSTCSSSRDAPSPSDCRPSSSPRSSTASRAYAATRRRVPPSRQRWPAVPPSTFPCS